jgi:predicted kinase
VAVLVTLAGLPGTGKTSLARALAVQLPAVHVRIDTLEAAIAGSSLGEAAEAGYLAGYAVAGDNLALGLDVIADSVNALEITRQAWRDTAAQAQAQLLEVELVCSDPDQHRARVEGGPGRSAWTDIQARRVDPWTTEPLCLDTAVLSVDEAAATILEALELHARRPKRPSS